MIPQSAISKDGTRVSRRKLRLSLGGRRGRKANTKSNIVQLRPKIKLNNLVQEALKSGYIIGS